MEGNELAVEERQARLEQVFYELRTGLEEYHAEITQRIESMPQQIQALQEQNQQLARHLEDQQPRARALQSRLQQQEQALRDKANMEKQIRWLFICMGILAGLSLAALAIAIFLR